MSRLAGAVLCVLVGFTLLACADEATPFEVRAANIEERLLASCSCHPKKIEGLPLQTRIREDIRSGLLEGLDDEAVLWNVLQMHGTALLTAGVDDLEIRARAVLVTTPVLLLIGAGALLLQLRRS